MGHVKAMIIGESGAGKSHLAATAPRPLILLTEPNGAMSIMHSNPNAMIIQVDNLEQFQEAYMAIHYNAMYHAGERNSDGKPYSQPPEFKGLEFDTIVIDSMTELQRYLIDDIKGPRDPKTGKTKHMSLQDYGELGHRMSGMIRRLCKLPYHIVFTSLCEVQTEGEHNTRHMYPLLTGKLRYTVQQYFVGVGYLYQTGGENAEGSAQRALLLDGHDQIKTKAFPNMTGTIKDPDLTEIFNSIMSIAGEV